MDVDTDTEGDTDMEDIAAVTTVDRSRMKFVSTLTAVDTLANQDFASGVKQEGIKWKSMRLRIQPSL